MAKIIDVFEKKRKSKWKKVLAVSLIFILLITAGAGYYFHSKLSKVKTVKIQKTNEKLGISKETASKTDAYEENIVNIAFFGLDRRHKDDPARSDCIGILTIDRKNKKIKLSSLMRDTYVNVDGHGMTKLTHAYAYGGAQLAIKTINENFKLNVKDYVAVDFFSLEKIIDDLGGIDLNITPEELKYINGYIREISNLEHTTVPAVTNSGVQHVNGKQAVAYSRIRYTAGGDFERTERQRIVLSVLLKKIKQDGSTKLIDSLNKLLPSIETSMSSADIIKTANSVFLAGINNLEEERFPLDGYCKGVIIDRIWYLQTDLDVTSNQMNKFIFNDIKPVPGEPLF